MADDKMLERMRAATPGGALFSTAPLPARMVVKPREQHERRILGRGMSYDKAEMDAALSVQPPFDEAQSYATGMRALAVVSHPVLIAQMARDALKVREALARGETVRITTSTGLELALYEPEP